MVFSLLISALCQGGKPGVPRFRMLFIGNFFPTILTKNLTVILTLVLEKFEDNATMKTIFLFFILYFFLYFFHRFPPCPNGAVNYSSSSSSQHSVRASKAAADTIIQPPHSLQIGITGTAVYSRPQSWQYMLRFFFIFFPLPFRVVKLLISLFCCPKQ